MAIFFVVILGELVALLLTLSASRLPVIDWQYLGASSLFIQWLGLLSAVILCACKSLFAPLSIFRQVALVYIMVLSITALCAWFATLLLPIREPVVWWVARCLLICAIVVGVACRYFVLQYRYRLQQQAELSQRIEVLQARIRPHFLFNTLNSIASVIPVDPEKAETMILDFADIMRDATQQPTLISFEKELLLCKQYLALEQMRFGEKLAINWDINVDTHAVQLPNLLLQPIIENAIYHGIQQRTDGGAIDISAHIQTDILHIVIANPLPKTTETVFKGQQLAIDNIKHRLEVVYGRHAYCKCTQSSTDYYVALAIPTKTLL